jgi:hypothetical protein
MTTPTAIKEQKMATPAATSKSAMRKMMRACPGKIDKQLGLTFPE